MRLIDADALAAHKFKNDISYNSFCSLIKRQPTVDPPTKGFDVIDKKTGTYPDLWKIALEEDWAKDLCYCDMEGFAIEEDGTLILLDECGRHEYCPKGRFEIIPERAESKAPEWKSIYAGHPELREDKYEDLTFMISKPVLGYNAETGVMEVVLYEEDHEAPEFIGYISQFGDGFPITHWMPLPEPPEKSK